MKKTLSMAGDFVSHNLSNLKVAYIARHKAKTIFQKSSIWRIAQNGAHGSFKLQNSLDTDVATSASLNRRKRRRAMRLPAICVSTGLMKPRYTPLFMNSLCLQNIACGL